MTCRTERPRTADLCAALLAGVAAALAPGAAWAQAPTVPNPAAVEAASGRWTLALAGTNRQCTLTLRLEPEGAGFDLRYPATCRRALPVTARLGGWLAGEDGAIRLFDESGATTLEFVREGERLTARLGEETYLLERLGPGRESARLALPQEPPPGAPRATPVDPASAPRPSTLPGEYALDRYREGDVCRLRLTSIPVDVGGRFGTLVLDGCRDQGIIAFDPSAWRYENGRLTLFSRRGHSVELIFEKDVWRRDPEVGAMLNLRKVGL